jgi:hypothetical protein
VVNRKGKLTALFEVLQEIGFASELANQLAGKVHVAVAGIVGARVDKLLLHFKFKL